MVYVAFVIDAFARRIIGWRAARSMTTDLLLDAVEHAFFTRSQEGIAHLTRLASYSDSGSEYTSVALTSRAGRGRRRPVRRIHRRPLRQPLARDDRGLIENEVVRREQKHSTTYKSTPDTRRLTQKTESPDTPGGVTSCRGRHPASTPRVLHRSSFRIPTCPFGQAGSRTPFSESPRLPHLAGGSGWCGSWSGYGFGLVVT